jgi:hypothetical protein
MIKHLPSIITMCMCTSLFQSPEIKKQTSLFFSEHITKCSSRRPCASPFAGLLRMRLLFACHDGMRSAQAVWDAPAPAQQAGDDGQWSIHESQPHGQRRWPAPFYAARCFGARLPGSCPCESKATIPLPPIITPVTSIHPAIHQSPTYFLHKKTKSFYIQNLFKK